MQVFKPYETSSPANSLTRGPLMQIQGQLMREKRANLAKSLSQKCKLTS